MKVFVLIGLCFLYTSVRAQLQKAHEIDSLRRISFTLYAPEAHEIKLINLSDENALGAKEYDFERGTNGHWSLITNPCRPGLHYYEISIDGVKVPDPMSKMYFGWAKWTGMVEIPDDSNDFYLAKNVPHGEVRQHYYFSELTQNTRKCLVYTPPGYDKSKANYPVVYLQHGSGESELGWTMQGKVNFIMDNLLAEEKVVPFIVVMDNGYAPRIGAENQYNPGEADNLFTELVNRELVPMIDANYRTLTDSKFRAIAGLSMGGSQAMNIGFSHPELFGTVANFSGAGWKKFDIEKERDGLFNNTTKFNRKYRLFFIGCGTLEPIYPNMMEMFQTMKKRELNVAFSKVVGSHEWQVWRVNFYDFAQLVFR